MTFRFFVNVDGCLNMRHFDFFFYKKRSEKCLHLTPDVCLGENGRLSFFEAASNIRLYIDREAYMIGDYQIVVAMRRSFKYDAKSWRDTLLSSFLDIDLGLRQAKILVRSGLETQVAVNLIALYEVSRVDSIHMLDEPYMGSDRLVEDCKLLLREIGVPEDTEDDLVVIKNAWEKYKVSHADDFEKCSKMHDNTPAHPLFQFFENLLKSYEKELSRTSTQVRKISTRQALKDYLSGYQVFELLTDKLNRNKDINALLRLVEFITTDYIPPVDMGNTVSLSDSCLSHWQSVMATKEQDLQKKYADMLAAYKKRLSHFVLINEKESAALNQSSKLPEINIPVEDAIKDAKQEKEIDSIVRLSSEESGGADDQKQNKKKAKAPKSEPARLIREFRDHLFPSKTMLERWKSTHEAVYNIFDDLEKNLKKESACLGEIYVEILKKRERKDKEHRNSSFSSDSNTKQEIEQLKEQRKKELEGLSSPKMQHDLLYQDQLNMNTALDQVDQLVTHYIQCIRGITFFGFFLMTLLVVGLVALLYGCFQSYVFTDFFSLLIFIGYVSGSFLLMQATFAFPRSHFGRRIKDCLDNFEKQQIDTYITRYIDRLKQIRDYYNRTNRLDYIERQLQLMERAVKLTERMVDAKVWHIDQACDHLNKLVFFSGLIETSDESTVDPNKGVYDSLCDEPGITLDHTDDVVGCKLYWPQT